MALQAYGEHQAAAVCFAQAQQLAPQELRWVYYAGLAQLSLSHTAQALALFRQANEYLPAQIKAADIFFAINKMDEAEVVYRAAVKKNPQAQWAWYGLGRVQAVRQDFHAALNSFERAVSLSPQFGAAHYALALVLRDAGRIGKAKEHLALYQQYKLIRPASNDPWTEEIAALNLSAIIHLNRGLALEADGELAASAEEHEKALEVDPMLVQAHLNLIQLYGRLAQAEQAEKHYRAALLINPNLVEAHYNFGVMQLALQKTEAAKKAFALTLASNPHHAEAHYNLGLLRLQETKLAEAAQHFQAAIDGNPNFRQAHFQLGRILVHQNRLTEALQHFEQTLVPEDNDTPGFMYALAATYVRAEQRAKGLELLRQARELAVARGQKELLNSIDRDLKILEGNQ